jgi:hypothetical protein
MIYKNSLLRTEIIQTRSRHTSISTHLLIFFYELDHPYLRHVCVGVTGCTVAAHPKCRAAAGTVTDMGLLLPPPTATQRREACREFYGGLVNRHGDDGRITSTCRCPIVVAFHLLQLHAGA